MHKHWNRIPPIQKAIATGLLISLLQACGGSEDVASKSEDMASQVSAQSVPQVPLGAEDTDNGQPLDTASFRTGDASNRLPAHQSGLGVNLEAFSYYSGDFPTIDVFKRANNPGGWILSTGISDWGYEDPSLLSLDENGWIKQLPVSKPNGPPLYARAFMFKDDRNAHPIGAYTVVYEGEGDLVFDGMEGTAKTLPDQGDGKHRVQVTIGKGRIFSILIKATQPSNYVRNIQMLAPGGVCARDKLTVVDTDSQCGGSLGKFISMETLSRTQIWYPTFLKDLTGTRTLRFMDWGATNTNTLVQWSERPKWDNAFWGSGKGVPLGAMISLANTLNADAWINIPYQADDDYVRQAARLIKHNLNPNLKAVVEYANEPWNGQFSVVTHAKEQGNKVFIKDGTPMGKEWDRTIQWSSMRAAQVCQLVKAEFGTESARAHCTVNGWASNAWTTENQVLPCQFAVDKGLLPQACGRYFDSVSIAPYFGAYIGGDSDLRSFMRDNWFNQDLDYQLKELFKEIQAKDEFGNDLTTTPLAGKSPNAPKLGALNESKSWTDSYIKSKVITTDFKLPIMTYEAGQHLVVKCADADAACKALSNSIDTLFMAANRDKRMGDSYQTYINTWIAPQKGQLLTMFNNTGKYSSDGSWGLRENYLQPMDQTPKWQTVAPYRTTACWWEGCKN